MMADVDEGLFSGFTDFMGRDEQNRIKRTLNKSDYDEKYNCRSFAVCSDFMFFA